METIGYIYIENEDVTSATEIILPNLSQYNKFVIDLERVKYFNSEMIGFFIKILKSINTNGSVSLINVPKIMEKILITTGLNKHFEISYRK